MCGDFLQLPPVDKDGSRKSLVEKEWEMETSTVEGKEGSVKNIERKNAKLAETQ